LGWVPLLETAHGALSLCYFLSCPWKAPMSLIYASFWAVLTILKEPVLLLCLLLVSKGWGITRHVLQRREVCFAGSVLALLYASVSVQMSLQHSVLAQVPMIIMYTVMLFEIATSIWANLRILKGQLVALQEMLPSEQLQSTPVFKKYRMFVGLSVAVALYAYLEIMIHSLLGEAEHADDFALFILLHQVMELLVAIIIGYHFRSRPFHIHTAQVAAVAAELADQMLPSITTIEVKMDLENGEPDKSCIDNRIAWCSDSDRARDNRLPATVIVLNPGDEELPPPPRSSALRPGRGLSDRRGADSAPYEGLEMATLPATSIGLEPVAEVSPQQPASPQPSPLLESRGSPQRASPPPPALAHRGGTESDELLASASTPMEERDLEALS